MFELITISNGLAVVQHAPTGQVYRFRPIRSGLWHTLTLERVDASNLDEATSGKLAGAALGFAEKAVSSICQIAIEAQLLTLQMPPPRRMPFGLRKSRRRLA